jgi:hypothetical protein
MAYIAKSDLEIRLSHNGFWSAQLVYDRVLPTLGDQEPQTPLVYTQEVRLNALPDDIELDPSHYQVSFTLGMPFFNPAQENIAFLGDSLLHHGRSINYTTVGNGKERFRLALVPNDNDRLAKIIALIPVAHAAQEAEDIAYRAVRPLLSQLSVVYRVPVETVLVERFLFQRPDIVKYWRMILYPYMPKQIGAMDVVRLQSLIEFDSFAKAVNHYREGANSGSPLHRFLSWFKASEAVIALRNDLRTKRGLTKFGRTTVADTAAARLLFPECIGRPHTEFLDARLRDPYRNAAAHWGKDDDIELIHDLRQGLLTYYLLCTLAAEVFHGLFDATAKEIQPSAE